MRNPVVVVIAILALGVGLCGVTVGVLIQHHLLGEKFTYAILDRGRAGRVLLLTPVSTETCRIGDPVAAELMDAWWVDGQTVLPAGTRIEGCIARAEFTGRTRHNANLAIRYDRIVLPGGGDLQISSRLLVFEAGGGFEPDYTSDEMVLPAGAGMLLRLLDGATVPVPRFPLLAGR